MSTRESRLSVLITGGAGFIGSRLAHALVAVEDRVDRVCVFDSLHPQVHGEVSGPPNLPDSVGFVRGDVRDSAALDACVAEAAPDLVFHLAAETGTGQSLDEITRYCDVNVGGTARLIEALRRGAPACQRVVLAGTRAVYGEGAWRRPDGSIFIPEPRLASDMRAGRFRPLDESGASLAPEPTSEDLPPRPGNVYATTKLAQEYLLRQASETASWRPLVLRLQNVYGPGQSLRNPYTGVLSIFCSQILASKRLHVYEDGEIVRDFVYVDDVVRALLAAGLGEAEPSGPVNVGSGVGVRILDAARLLLRLLGAPEDDYEVTGEFRPGDVRHAVANVTRARRLLDWSSTTSFEEGMAALTERVASGSERV